MSSSKRIIVALVAALATLGLAVPVTASEDPFNGSWQTIDPRDGGAIHLSIGGGNHHVVGTDEDGSLCRPETAQVSGSGEIDEDGNLVVDLDVFCFEDEDKVFAGVVPNATFIDNGDGTLTWEFPGWILRKTGH